MRYTLLFISLLLGLNLTVHNLQTPEIESVTVDTTTGRPVIKWKISDPSLVDGYVVKRLIYDGVGVMPGTYNNVAVINDPSVNEWVDNSTDYSTFADPASRKEYYRVAAFVENNSQKTYSLMSEAVSTTMFFAEYDRCTNKYTLKWTKIEGVDLDYCYLRSGEGGIGERLGVIQNDTTTQFSFPKHLEERKFAVEFVLKNGLSVYSPIVTVVAANIKVPDEMSVVCVSTNNSNLLDIAVNVSASADITKTYLMRTLMGDSTDSQVFKLPVSTNGEMVFVDTVANPALHYNYRVMVYGECDTPVAFSSGAHNVVLEVSEGEGNSNLLSWNSQNIFLNGNVKSTTVYSVDDDGTKTLIDNVSGFYSSYSVTLSNIIANKTNYSGKFCYQVACEEDAATNPHTAFSNIVCINREPMVFVPNAINPEDDNIDNRYFRPRADFMSDYKMYVYNKRGEQIFATTDPEEGWDGRNRSGKLYPPDAYLYVISYRSSAGERLQKTGFVNLVYQQ